MQSQKYNHEIDHIITADELVPFNNNPSAATILSIIKQQITTISSMSFRPRKGLDFCLMTRLFTKKGSVILLSFPVYHCNFQPVHDKSAFANHIFLGQFFLLFTRNNRSSFYQYWLTWIPACKHMPSKVQDEITYPFPNFNGSPLKFGNG